MSIDAMKQALEALELWSPALGHALNKRAEAVVALRAAIEQAQPEQEQWDAIPDAFNEWWDADYDDTGNPYRKDSPAYWAWSGWKAASKQPEQEYRNAVEGWVKIDEVREHFDSVGCGVIYKTAGEDRTPLYTTPPQRKPLPPQSPCEMTQAEGKMFKLGWLECEAAHGIKGEA